MLGFCLMLFIVKLYSRKGIFKIGMKQIVEVIIHQINLCVSLARKTKQEYFHHLDLKKITDNKFFLKNATPF